MPSTVQRLTPRGPGAVAVLELRCDLGQQLTELCSAFSAGPSHDLNTLAIGRIIYGQWGGEDIVLMRTEQSAWEIHCHGGTIAIQRIINDLVAVGVRDNAVSETGLVPQQDINDASITRHVEYVLSQCRTRKTAAIVLAQTDGRLHQLWRNLNSNDEMVCQSAEKTRRAWQHVANHIASPWTVALVGPPNAGKSSLMNAIAGRQRAIVSETPGTTRDLLEAEVIIDGWPFLFVDSAGIRNSTFSQIEAVGISRSKALAKSADVACLVVDHSSTFTDTDVLQNVIAPSCVLLNKTDLPKSKTLDQLVMPAVPRFEVSAVTGDGLPKFLAWLVREVIPTEPDAQTTVPILPASADST